MPFHRYSLLGTCAVRIPLDYYRILGLPIQATAEQLRQAHRDRALQLPRREFSEAAVTARKELLDEAYAVLSDPEKRQSYDAGFLAKTYELEAANPFDAVNGSDAPEIDLASESTTDAHTPSVEIQDEQLVGALLILLELGEYELVLKLGRPFLGSGNASLSSGRYGQPEIVRSDIVLTLAFACLELGREQWQQGQYENAAESLEIGQELLLREGLFAGVRGEMQSDLYKLRPYRILELLAVSDQQEQERQKGQVLLRDMLQDRGGIDGAGDDQSGLTVDDFLRFIQQLRSYLTSTEQQSLFEAEARRPSAVATYLAVYALLAKGFAYQQPALIRRAKMMLIRLGTRQDVHLEQAVCALLLGQTEEASRALELSQEHESLAFIREHSQESPDLLPGLCLYSERWLQTEVFPHFRDLSSRQASLKEYFANDQVQAYLEELPNEETNPWAVPAAAAANGHAPSYKLSEPRESRARTGTQTVGQGGASYASSTATLDMPEMPAGNGFATPTADRPPAYNPEPRPEGGAPTRPPSRPRPQPSPAIRSSRPSSVPNGRAGSGRGGFRLDYLLAAIALAATIGLLTLFINSLRRPNTTGTATTTTGATTTLKAGIDPAMDALITPPATAVTAEGALTTEQAQQIVQSWLNAKSAAMGSSHNVEPLEQILTGSALNTWRRKAEAAKASNSPRTFTHGNVSVTEVTMADGNPDRATVVANVTENDSPLTVAYSVVRQDGQWKIRGWTVR